MRHRNVNIFKFNERNGGIDIILSAFFSVHVISLFNLDQGRFVSLICLFTWWKGSVDGDGAAGVEDVLGEKKAPRRLLEFWSLSYPDSIPWFKWQYFNNRSE